MSADLNFIFLPQHKGFRYTGAITTFSLVPLLSAPGLTSIPPPTAKLPQFPPIISLTSVFCPLFAVSYCSQYPLPSLQGSGGNDASPCSQLLSTVTE